MPIKLSYTKDGGILAVGSGILTGQEVKDVNAEVYKTPQMIKAIAYQLVDFSEVTKLEATASEVEDLARQDEEAARINPDMFIALVGKDDLIYGMSRMWEGLASSAPIETMVFRKLGDAKKWIKEKLNKET